MKKYFGIILICILSACSDTGSSDPLAEGWEAFANGDYTGAVDILTVARDKHPNDGNIRAALGWSFMRLDQLAEADAEFETGAVLASAPPDLYAGWSFVLNALKEHASSNDQIVQALAASPNWVFRYDSSLTYQDLQLLQAENYFVLGEFQLSLASVLEVNPGFTADVSTDDGKGHLAAEIERLRALRPGKRAHAAVNILNHPTK